MEITAPGVLSRQVIIQEQGAKTILTRRMEIRKKFRLFGTRIKSLQQMYIITVKQVVLEFQYTQGHFKIPIISTYAKIMVPRLSAEVFLNAAMSNSPQKREGSLTK